MERFTDYDPFAWLYATHWGSEYHEQAYGLMDKLLLRLLPAGASILDLGCGDGRLTLAISRRGFDVTGLDGSDAILAFARERCPDVRFVLGDARTFDMPDRFDAALSTFDALNHVMTADDLAAVFRSTHAALKSGGYFAFDLNREQAYTDLWPRTSAIVERDMVSIAEGSYNAFLRTAYCDVTLFRLAGAVWVRSDFRMTQYCHREDDVNNALYAAGFAEVRRYDAAVDLGMYGNIGQGRTFYLARKGV
jgi:SAM-dependent methyltransferase